MTPKAFAEKYWFVFFDGAMEDFRALLAHVRQCERRKVATDIRLSQARYVKGARSGRAIIEECAYIAERPGKKGKKR